MKIIYTILLGGFCFGLTFGQTTRATIKSNGLTAEAYIKDDVNSIVLANSSNDVSLIIAFSLPANGSTNPADAPTVTGAVNNAFGGSATPVPVYINQDRFVYTYQQVLNVPAQTIAAGTETLLFSLTFDGDANNYFPRLEQLLSTDGSESSYFYMEVNGTPVSDTEGDAFYAEAGASEGTNPDGEAYVEAAMALPIELSAFDATRTSANSALVTWTSQTETNASHFEVQRQINGKGFETVGRVDATGDSDRAVDYKFSDERVPSQSDDFVAYYRLKMVDLDGVFEFSETKAVDFDGKPVRAFVIAPNRTNDQVFVSLDDVSEQGASLRVYDLQGQLVLTQTLSHGQSEAVSLAEFPAGMYLFNIGQEVQRVVKVD